MKKTIFMLFVFSTPFVQLSYADGGSQKLKIRSINSEKSYAAVGGYSQAIEVSGEKRTLYISGQVPETVDGTVPEGFANQARLAWANLTHQLEAAGMTLDNITRHTTYLSRRAFCDENSKIRQEILGARKPALTVIITDIYDEAWLLEIEAIAVD